MHRRIFLGGAAAVLVLVANARAELSLSAGQGLDDRRGGGGAGGGGGSDPSFSNVVLLLHFDGANGSCAISDSSPAAHVLSCSSTTTLTTAQQKFGTASLQPAGTGAAQSADSPDWTFGQLWTVEAWVRPTASLSGVTAVAAQFGGSTFLGWFLGFNGNTLNFFYSTTGSDNPVISGAYTPTVNQWAHIAADRDASNVLRIYADGVVIASGTVAATFNPSTRNLNIGNDDNTSRTFVGQIDEVRITKGVARYGGAFTPPTASFPNQ